MSCPHCTCRVIRRARRHNIIERILSAGYIYPFRCRRCRFRFLALRWGQRYTKRVMV